MRACNLTPVKTNFLSKEINWFFFCSLKENWCVNGYSKKKSWTMSFFSWWPWNREEITYFHLFKYTLKLGWVLIMIELYACKYTQKQEKINMWCNNRYLNSFGQFLNVCHEPTRERNSLSFQKPHWLNFKMSLHNILQPNLWQTLAKNFSSKQNVQTLTENKESKKKKCIMRTCFIWIEFFFTTTKSGQMFACLNHFYWENEWNLWLGSGFRCISIDFCTFYHCKVPEVGKI